MLFVTKLQKLFDMTKPRLAKVRALFYVFQHVIKRGCAVKTELRHSLLRKVNKFFHIGLVNIFIIFEKIIS